MKEPQQKQHTIDILFVLTLFCVFTLSTLAIVYVGSHVYSSTVDTLDENFHNYVAVDYINKKVHQGLNGHNIEVKNIDNIDVLLIHQTYNEQAYTTYIYNDRNQLKELFVSDEQSFDKANGQVLMNIDSLSFEIKDSLLNVSLSVNKKTNYFYISLRKGALSS